MKPLSQRGLARQRVLDAALALFAEHGVHGTSLQMIADRIGVGKAAVYYQFRSKEDIALEVIRPAVEDMARVVRIAEALPDTDAKQAVAISGLIELTVRHRHVAYVFHGDPAIGQLVRSHPEIEQVNDRLRRMLEGPKRDPASLIACLVLFAGLGCAAADPALSEVDDVDLRRTLLDLSNRIIGSGH